MKVDKIPTVWLPITYKCNNRCSWCYAKNEAPNKKELYISNEDLFLNFLSDLGVGKIVLIGGEPTLYKNIHNLINKFRKKNIRVGMVSNGRRLSDYGFCKKLKDVGISSTTVSIEGSKDYLHDGITNINGSFKQSIAGLENLIDLGIPASTETVMSKENNQDLENIVALTEQYDLKQSAYSICGVCLTDEQDSSFSFSLSEGAKLFERVFVKARYKERTKLVTSPLACSFDPQLYPEMKKSKSISKGCFILTGSRFVLEPNGDIIPCVHFAGFPIMNVFENGKIMSTKKFLEEYNSEGGVNLQFRKLLSHYPSTKCKEGDCWGTECLGGCPIFWSKYNPEDEIKGMVN